MFRLFSLVLLAGLASACVDDATASDSQSAVANAATGSGGCRRPPPLPQAAIDACANQSAGASCAFDIDSHHITGTCRQGPNGNGPLACAPDQPPPGGGSGGPPPPPPGGGGSAGDCGPPPAPPQAALDACASSTAGASCAFDLDSHHITGTCRQPPDGSGALACAPDQPPPR